MIKQEYFTPEEIVLLRQQLKRGIEDARAELEKRGHRGVHPRIKEAQEKGLLKK